MTSKPLVSVVMPVKGSSPFLTPAILSILTQTLHDVELLLIGYPNDRSWHQHLPTDSRIKVISRDGPGIVPALNKGIEHATGRFIARMDADDLAYPTRLEQQVSFLSDTPDVHIAGTKVRLFSDDAPMATGNQQYEHWLNSCQLPLSIQQNLFVESPLPHPTWCAERTVFTRLNGYRDTSWPEDYDFLLRAHLNGLRMGKPNDVLMDWRDHPTRLTRKDSRYSKQAFIQAKGWAMAQSVAKGRDVIICGMGRNAVRLHDALTSEGINVIAFVEQDNARPRTSRRHKPVVTYQQLFTEKPNALVISAVTAWGAGEALRSQLQQRGWTEYKDFVIAG